MSACVCESEHVEMQRRDNEETGGGDVCMVGERQIPEIDYAKKEVLSQI